VAGFHSTLRPGAAGCLVPVCPSSLAGPAGKLPAFRCTHAVRPLLQSWLRNWVAVSVLYYGLGSVWIYYTYYAFGSRLFKPGEIPDWASMLEQMKVGACAGPAFLV
jgi:hypothetical protein